MTPPTAYATSTMSHHGACRSSYASANCRATSALHTYLVRQHGPYSSLMRGYRWSMRRRRSAWGSRSSDQLKPGRIGRNAVPSLARCRAAGWRQKSASGALRAEPRRYVFSRSDRGVATGAVKGGAGEVDVERLQGIVGGRDVSSVGGSENRERFR